MKLPEMSLNGVLSLNCWAWPPLSTSTAFPDTSHFNDNPTCTPSFIQLPPKITLDTRTSSFKKSNHCARRWLWRSRIVESNLWLALKGWWNSLWVRAHSLISSIFISSSTGPCDANLSCCQTAFYQFAQEEALRSSDRKWSFWPVGRFYFWPSWHESQMLRCVRVVGVTRLLPSTAVPPANA